MPNIPKLEPLSSQAITTPEIISSPSQTWISRVSNIMPRFVKDTEIFKKITNITDNIENKEQHNNKRSAINSEIKESTTTIQQNDKGVENQTQHQDRHSSDLGCLELLTSFTF